MNKQDIVFSGIGRANFNPSAEFTSIFPLMTELLQNALIIDFVINENQRFRKYIWTRRDNTVCGWLCQLEHCVPQGRNLLSEHILFSKNVGGILKYWIENKSVDINTFIDNNIFTFSLLNSFVGIGDWKEKYIADCNHINVEPLNVSDFVTFALEANGNTTFYHKETKEVFVFAQDGYSVFDIAEVDNQPDYTIHKYKGISTFVDYVEMLASQWLKIVK